MAQERANAAEGTQTHLVRDDNINFTQLALVEKYEQVINYCYPIFQSLPRKHGVARDFMLRTLFGQVELFILAGKAQGISRLYAADANLALLRFWLRFAADSNRKLITMRQHQASLALKIPSGQSAGMPGIAERIWVFGGNETKSRPQAALFVVGWLTSHRRFSAPSWSGCRKQ